MLPLQQQQTSNSQLRFQTIENKRASVYHALLQDPNDQRLRQAIMRLNSPQQIKQASKDGIFISYARGDELLALEIYQDLTKRGFTVWLDILEVSVGGDWDEEVQQAIAHCGMLLWLVSRDSFTDSHLRKERYYFMRQGKIILPITHENSPQNLNIPLMTLDFKHGYNTGLQMLLNLTDPRTTDEMLPVRH